MKKRSQPPDAYTYSILLRGLAHNADFPQSPARALAIYNSMYAENSPVRPTIIHTNAVLKVFSRAHDIDSLFEVAAKLPRRGRGAPDNKTFTTIINAIRHNAMKTELLRHSDADGIAALRQQAVLQGRRMWEDIIGRWRDGGMLLDDEMVNAIGQLLLLRGEPEDCDDVLSLVEQTMCIPRGVPRLGDPARKTHLTPARGSREESRSTNSAEEHDLGRSNSTATAVSADTPTSSELANYMPTSSELANYMPTSSELDSYELDSTPAPRSLPASSALTSVPPNEFSPLPLTPSSLPRSYASPSRHTLSLILDACTRMHAYAAGQSYWNILTSPPYGLIPDEENYHTYLRFLRATHSSRLACALVEDMARPRDAGGLGVEPQAKTYRIAMSACVRDGNNDNVGAYATALLRTMAKRLEEPDLKTCEMFISVFEKVVGQGKPEQSKTNAEGEDVGWAGVVQSLGELEVVMQNLRSMLAYGGTPPPSPPSFSPSSSLSSSSSEQQQDQFTPPLADVHDDDDDADLERLEDLDPTDTSLPLHLRRAVSASQPASPSLNRRAGLHRVSDIEKSPSGRVKAGTYTAVRKLAQRMVGLYDRVMARGRAQLVPATRHRVLERRALLSLWVRRALDQEFGGRWRRWKGRDGVGVEDRGVAPEEGRGRRGVEKGKGKGKGKGGRVDVLMKSLDLDGRGQGREVGDGGGGLDRRDVALFGGE